MKIKAYRGPNYQLKDGRWLIDVGPKIKDFDNFYLEYSLIGSSKALSL